MTPRFYVKFYCYSNYNLLTSSTYFTDCVGIVKWFRFDSWHVEQNIPVVLGFSTKLVNITCKDVTRILVKCHDIVILHNISTQHGLLFLDLIHNYGYEATECQPKRTLKGKWPVKWGVAVVALYAHTHILLAIRSSHTLVDLYITSSINNVHNTPLDHFPTHSVLTQNVAVFDSLPLPSRAVFDSLPLRSRAVYDSLPLRSRAVFDSLPLPSRAVFDNLPLRSREVFDSLPLCCRAVFHRVSLPYLLILFSSIVKQAFFIHHFLVRRPWIVIKKIQAIIFSLVYHSTEIRFKIRIQTKYDKLLSDNLHSIFMTS